MKGENGFPLAKAVAGLAFLGVVAVGLVSAFGTGVMLPRKDRLQTPTPALEPAATLTPAATAAPTTPTPAATTAAAPPTATPGPAPAAAPAPDVAWVLEFGSPEWDRGNGIGVDGSGNVIVAGAREGAAPGQTSAGSWDAFAVKFSPSGGGLWSYQAGSSGSDGALAMAVDASGNTILAGHTDGTLPGETNAGYDDAWVRKLSPAGVELWTRQFGSPQPDWAFGVTTDGSGNVIVAGGTDSALPDQTPAGLQDAWVRVFSAAGIELWTQQFGSPAADRATGVTVDGSGNIIVVGRTEGALPDQINAGSWDAFARKLSPSGTELWTTQFGSPAPDLALAVAADASGNIFVAGNTYGFLPEETQAGSGDAFVRKLSPAGTEFWTRQFGTVLSDEASGIAVDFAGNAFVAGITEGTLPGQTSAGSADAFVRKFSPAGVELWTHQFGSPAADLAFGVAVDGTVNVFVVGHTYGAFPGQTNAGSWDAFVLSLDQQTAS